MANPLSRREVLALTLHTAAEYPGVTAAVPWYGHVRRTYSDAPGVDAFSLADRIKAPVLGLYGEADPGIPADGGAAWPSSTST
jgi:dienelactone hydrolase